MLWDVEVTVRVRRHYLIEAKTGAEAKSIWMDDKMLDPAEALDDGDESFVSYRRRK